MLNVFEVIFDMIIWKLLFYARYLSKVKGEKSHLLKLLYMISQIRENFNKNGMVHHTYAHLHIVVTNWAHKHARVTIKTPN